jgi:opacity protein-like surface antigen
MSSLRNLLLISLTFATTSLCHAAGVYVRGSALYTKPSDLSVTNAGAFKASLKNNVGVAGALGYKFSLLRVEGELQRVSVGTEADHVSGTLLAGTSDTIGKVKETSGFANAYFDFPSFFGLAPYLGAGLGYARVNLDNVARLNTSSTGGTRSVIQFSGSDAVFGYQGMAGLQFHFLGQGTIYGGFRLMKKEDITVRDVVANASRTLASGTNRVFELGVAIGF